MLSGDLRQGTGSRPSPRPSYSAARSSPARRAAIILIVTAVTVALVRGFLVQSFVVPTDSMTPTVKVGDRVLVSRLSYRFGRIKRGDVIVFNGAGVFDPELAPPRNALVGLGRDIASAFSLPIGSQDYVKRVVGLPGERVTCCDAQGRLLIDGVPLNEPYVAPGNVPSAVKFDIVVPAGRLWVMGDHRNDSADSRAHLGDPGGGTVPEDRVVGRVIARFWPLSHIGGIGRTSSSDLSGAAAGPTPLQRKDHG